MYDRDWYREERRQQRQAARESAQQQPTQPTQTIQQGPPDVFSVKSIFIISIFLIAGLIVYGLQ